MNGTDRNARLRNFFAAYFNQDWMVEGAKSWEDVLGQFLKENGEAGTRVLRDDLLWWLDETAIEEQKNLPPQFGCDFDPQSVGLNDRQWVQNIIDEFNRLLHN